MICMGGLFFGGGGGAPRLAYGVPGPGMGSEA